MLGMGPREQGYCDSLEYIKLIRTMIIVAHEHHLSTHNIMLVVNQLLFAQGIILFSVWLDAQFNTMLGTQYSMYVHADVGNVLILHQSTCS